MDGGDNLDSSRVLNARIVLAAAARGKLKISDHLPILIRHIELTPYNTPASE
jgi:hypothetical protein